MCSSELTTTNPLGKLLFKLFSTSVLCLLLSRGNIKYNITYKYATPMSIPCRVTRCICNKHIFSILNIHYLLN